MGIPTITSTSIRNSCVLVLHVLLEQEGFLDYLMTVLEFMEFKINGEILCFWRVTK